MSAPGRQMSVVRQTERMRSTPVKGTSAIPFDLAPIPHPSRTTAFGLYLHVPFCSSRCGYCDFNTYTAEELGPGATRSSYADTAATEIRSARRTLGPDPLPVATVFIGGGTPTLLPPSDLVRLVDIIGEEFGLAEDAEITTEANPDSIDAAGLAFLRAGGFTRISFGMQSTSSRVLQMLDRTHTPGRAIDSVRHAREAGFEHVSVDLIYGTPGETADDLARSLDAAIESGVDHVSAYALVVEEGTRLGARVARGEMPAPDDDVAAERYAQVDQRLQSGGFEWYELSNWSRPGGECRHNLGYWRGCDWWGIGPGAHSHVQGLRWWNRRHPLSYADALADGLWPADGSEVLTDEDRRTERLMLAIRLREGLDLAEVAALTGVPHGGAREDRLSGLLERGLIDSDAHADGVLVLTRSGRLVADAIVRDLLVD